MTTLHLVKTDLLSLTNAGAQQMKEPSSVGSNSIKCNEVTEAVSSYRVIELTTFIPAITLL